MQAKAMIAGTRRPGMKKPNSVLASLSEARKAVRANRSAQARTRLARIAVFVQNSSVVGARSRTANRATITPKTIRATLPSGTVLGAGMMQRAKIRISGEVTRISHSGLPQSDERSQLATMQWSGTGASATATKIAKLAMKATSM